MTTENCVKPIKSNKKLTKIPPKITKRYAKNCLFFGVDKFFNNRSIIVDNFLCNEEMNRGVVHKKGKIIEKNYVNTIFCPINKGIIVDNFKNHKIIKKSKGGIVDNFFFSFKKLQKFHMRKFFSFRIHCLLKRVFVFIFSFIFAFSFGGCNEGNVSSLPRATVVIDPGHGGIDGGVSGNVTGARESDINLAISLIARDLLESYGVNVVMTRTNSNGLYGVISKGFKKRDMEKRREIINGCCPSLVISIHQNNFSSSLKRGCQLYFKNGDKRAEDLALSLKNGLKSVVKSGGCNILTGDYYILNISPCPAVIAECGFLSNAHDEKLLLSGEYQRKLASAIAFSVMEYLSVND